MHEIKYVIDNHRAHLIRGWLRSRCLPDPEYPEGIVSSIYFDTPSWTFLSEKINSDFLKTKIRIRWYGNLGSRTIEGDAFLEAKFKQGNRRAKIRIPLPRKARWLDGISLQDTALPSYLKLLYDKMPLPSAPLRPAFQITYKRWRFLEPVKGLRINFDADIHAPKVNIQMLPRPYALNLSEAVFEMKGGEAELPGVLHQLTALGCRKESFSKYIECFRQITRTVA